MDERPLNVIAIWVLLAVSEEPCHLYGLRGRIYGLSLAYVIPNPETLRSSLKMLVREGLVADVGYEEGSASRFNRKMYRITDKGLGALHYQRTGLMMAVKAIDHAEARRFIEAGGWRQARLD